VIRDVAVVVSAPVPAFELGILSEVFGLRRIDATLPAYRYAVCAEWRDPLPTTSGFAVTPTHGLRRVASADAVFVTGAAPPVPPPSPALAGALQAAARRGAIVASVCTGAFTLAGAGLLDGRRATTHWAYADLLARTYPAVRVESDSLYVVDGGVATSAGSSAVIDLCLALLRDAHGAAVANRVARELVVPAHRRGGQTQYAQSPVTPAADSPFSAVLDWAIEHLDRELSVADIAARAAQSPRTFARRFRETTGTTPAAWVRAQRVLAAERLLEESAATVEAIAHRTGFGSADTLRRHFVRARGVPPETYRRSFRLSSVSRAERVEAGGAGAG
jgi:AraC family transcriptional regulator, transcriptional activator FtrA